MFRISLSSLAVVLLMPIGGCVTEPQRLQVCPGKATAAEALQALTARARTAVPLRATGQAMLVYHVPEKKSPERHNLPLELRFNPPSEVYIQGSVVADQRAVILGSNEQEFWLALSPKEMSSYYRGRWDEVRDFEGLMMSPRVVLEAFGIVADANGAPDAGRWALENKGPYDILTRRDEAGRPAERVHVYACDYLVHKIEYFDRRGKVVAVAQFGDYQAVEGFQVPTEIHVVSTAPDGRKDSMDIDITGPRTTRFSDKQRKGLFAPPNPNTFENIYRYEAGRWVPQ